MSLETLELHHQLSLESQQLGELENKTAAIVDTDYVMAHAENPDANTDMVDLVANMVALGTDVKGEEIVSTEDVKSFAKTAGAFLKSIPLKVIEMIKKAIKFFNSFNDDNAKLRGQLQTLKSKVAKVEPKTFDLDYPHSSKLLSDGKDKFDSLKAYMDALTTVKDTASDLYQTTGKLIDFIETVGDNTEVYFDGRNFIEEAAVPRNRDGKAPDEKLLEVVKVGEAFFDDIRSRFKNVTRNGDVVEMSSDVLIGGKQLKGTHVVPEGSNDPAVVKARILRGSKFQFAESIDGAVSLTDGVEFKNTDTAQLSNLVDLLISIADATAEFQDKYLKKLESYISTLERISKDLEQLSNPNKVKDIDVKVDSASQKRYVNELLSLQATAHRWATQPYSAMARYTNSVVEKGISLTNAALRHK